MSSTGTSRFFEQMSSRSARSLTQPAHLFDPTGLERPTPPPFSPASDEAVGAAVALDRSPQRRTPQLVRAPDGLPARRVALHSSDKAHYVRYYADIVGKSMTKAYPGPIAWVELFAGPGLLYVDPTQTFRHGSPLEAVGIDAPFDIYVFADLDSTCTDALRTRLGDRADTHVLTGNANSAELHDRIAALIPKNALVVLYADPEGLDLHFDTIRYFADRYLHLDLLLNFPVPGVFRALKAGHQEKAGKVLNHDAPLDLIGPTSGRPGISLREWFERQLGQLRYDQFDAICIRLDEKNSPLYDLMFASRERVAKKFFNEAKTHGPGGQYAMTFDC